MFRIVLCLTLLAWAPLSASAEHPVKFEVQWLAVDANEGCDIADFDGDGKLDVVAGRNWYRNGDWLPRPVRSFEDVNGYVQSNGDFVYDVNGDGHPDVIAGGFFDAEVYWYENPGPEKVIQGYQWPKHLLVDTGYGQNEASFLYDFDDDGVPEWISNSWSKTNPLIIWKLATEQRSVPAKQAGKKPSTETVHVLTRHLIGEVGQGHGFGIGDINNDGHTDLLTGVGWHQAPAGNPLEDPWQYHADWDEHWSDPVLVRDLNGDGRNDIICSKAHDYGLYVWYAEEPAADGKLRFRPELIDKEFSQYHCLHFADLDGDGRDELVTGKRVRAHNGRDPGGTEPPVICYYTIDNQGRFERHIIEIGTVGIGLQIRTADLDGDGDLDIVVAGKDGTQILFNQSE